MKICPNCGASVNDDVKFCTSCGTAMGMAAGMNQQQGANQQNTAANAFEMKDHTAEFAADDIENNKILSLFSYLGILVLIPILAAPNSKYARFHANQGLILLITTIAYVVAYAILSFILAFIPILGILLIFVLGLVNLVFLALMILGIVNAVTGKAKEMPIIGKFKILN